MRSTAPALLPVFRSRLQAELLLLSWGPLQVIAGEFAALEGTERVLIFGSWAARYHQRHGSPPRDLDVKQ
jgi:hypothetical protein